MATLAAVDLGAQSGRVAVGRFDGERLGVTEVHRFPNVPVRTRDTLNWDILRVYRDVLDGLRAAAREAGHVDSVAVDSWGVDFALIDSKGRLVQNPVHYRDARRARAMDGVLTRIPARELYDRTGIQLMPLNTVFELGAMAAEVDPALHAAETMLLIPDLLHYWLCGVSTSEFTNATTTQCFDPHAGGWAADLLERLDVPTRLLPDVVQPATRLAPLSRAVVEETRLGGAEVVAVATHDTGSAVAAVPFRQPGSIFISAGTWSLVGLETKEPVITDAAFAANLTNEGGVGGTFRLLRNVTGLWLIHECRRVWAEEGREHSFDQLVALAKDAPALQSFIDPDDATFGDPGDMPARVRAFCAHTGQPEPVEPGAIVRCILESLALKHAQTIDVLASVTGASPREIHVVGGGARNELLCRWTADAAGLPVLAGPEEATLLGNLLVQAVALGEISSLAEGREVVRASVVPTAYEPQETSTWQEAKERFAEAVALPTLEVGT
ncbi:MAG TPA: rhamnulokinase family protein [Gaiellaceae bacterium]|nr:rhamnulokinase family protein [Gaiellaceae bacterium]HXY84532.1 rhamnulokinase family protein [Gaiellaceae bacterium]